ncbi:MAG: hypothetical protein V7K67_05380 [Nostoc sp.]
MRLNKLLSNRIGAENAEKKPDISPYWRGKQKNSALDVGWVERSATQHPDICWVMQSLYYNFFAENKPDISPYSMLSCPETSPQPIPWQ